MKAAAAATYLLLPALLLIACSGEDTPTDPGDPSGDWDYGPARTYEADPTPGSIITDPTTGATLRFPDGGSGSVTLSEILSSPGSPGPGTGVRIEYDGTGIVFLDVDTTAGMYTCVYGHGEIEGAFDDDLGNGPRWVSLPREPASGGMVPFILMFPREIDGAAAPTQNTVGFNHYWIDKNALTNNQADQRINMRRQVEAYVDQIIGVLPTALRTTVSAKVKSSTHRYRVEHDGNYYTGFWWRSLGAYGRVVKPTIHVKLPGSSGTLAHETSHYMAHMLNTDEFQATLEGQAGFFDNHGIRDVVGRNVVVEEYAYFGQYFLTGLGGNYNLEEPRDVFGSLTPLTTDFPSLEGFGAVLLAQLVRTDGTIRSIIGGRDVNIPLAGLNYGQVFEIISRGAPGIEQLRSNIETAPGVDKKKLDGVLQRVGWSYSIRGILVDENNTPVSGALVSNRLTIGTTVYEGGYSSTPSGSDGSFRIVGDVFPGASTLRVIQGADTTDVDISIAYTNRTDQTVDLGEVRVEGLLARIKRTTQLTARVYCGVPHLWSWHNSNTGTSGQRTERFFEWELTAGVWPEEPNLTWTGNQFTFTFTGSRLGEIFRSPQASGLPMSDWVNQMTGTVDKTGKLLTASLRVFRVDRDSRNGKIENVELTLTNIEPQYVEPRGNSVILQWSLTPENVSNHLNIVQAGRSYEGLTDTYLSTDWQSGVDCYWNTPLETVFNLTLQP